MQEEMKKKVVVVVVVAHGGKGHTFLVCIMLGFDSLIRLGFGLINLGHCESDHIRRRRLRCRRRRRLFDKRRWVGEWHACVLLAPFISFHVISFHFKTRWLRR